VTARIFETEQINRLVHYYSHIDQRHQAAGEWWGGAIAIDHVLAGLPSNVQELTTTSSDKQHRWRAWIVNTQISRQQGSHWFTVVIGTETQLLHSIAALGAGDSCVSQLATDGIANSSDAGTASANAHQATSTVKLPDSLARPNFASACSSTQPAHSTDSINRYPNLFETPDATTTDMINRAQANAMHQPVVSWLGACCQWDSAVATNEHHRQKKRRALCKDYDNPLTMEVNSNEKLDAAMERIQQELKNRIQQIRATVKTFEASGILQSSSSSSHQQSGKTPQAGQVQNKAAQKDLSQYFGRATRHAADVAAVAASIPAVFTDAGSAFLRLRSQQHSHAEDSDFHVVKNALGLLRNQINRKAPHKTSTEEFQKARTIRQHFKDRGFGIIRFAHSSKGIPRQSYDHGHDWMIYYTKLLVLAQARRWP
jgi:hypothetical protein